MNIINAGSEHRILGTMLNSNKQLELISKIPFFTQGTKKGSRDKMRTKIKDPQRSQFKNDEKLPYLH